MAVRISRAVVGQIIELARADPRHEVCGLLTGDDFLIDGIIKAANVAADLAHYFEVDPAVLIAAHRNARQGGPRIIGCYHSHPGADTPLPSPEDAAQAEGNGWLWLIVASGTFGIWRAGDEGLHGRFVRLEVQLTDASAA